jgi:hypothetical protein
MNQAEQGSTYLMNIENMIRGMSWHKVRFLQKRETRTFYSVSTTMSQVTTARSKWSAG